jgi:hypothetical protein
MAKKSVKQTPRRTRKGTGPDIVHPTIPGAIGSRESPFQEGRDTTAEANLIIKETIEKIRGMSEKEKK